MAERYTIVTGNDQDVIEAVEKLLAEGWQLQGGVSFTEGEEYGTQVWIYSQALTRSY